MTRDEKGVKMAFDFGKIAGGIAKGASDIAGAVKDKAAAAADVAGTVATAAGGAVSKAADTVHQAASENIPGYAAGTEAVGHAASSAFAMAQDAAAGAKQKVDEIMDDGAEEYEAAIIAYNAAYTDMNDRGALLLRQRERAIDVIAFSEQLVNSIANRPKSFDTDFEEISIQRKEFTAAEEYAAQELAIARASAGAGGAGLAAGAAVASLAPTAAMWVATTFGTASTGAAISTLSGAAATNAALAWLGGGAVAAGGSGVVGGATLLTLAGPVGWGIAGATLLASVALFTKNRIQTREKKNEELLAVKTNTEFVREIDAKIGALLDQTVSLRDALNDSFVKSMHLADSDYSTLGAEDKMVLGALVNNTKTLATLLNTKIAETLSADDEGIELTAASEA